MRQQEIRAVKRLRNEKSIVILPADKGNATVVMDRTDYDDKVNSMLQCVLPSSQT